jgi:dephospho-CoA kinase
MIIGITGTIGAGKGTVVNYLVKEKGFTHLSVRDFLLGEIRHRGMEVDDRSAMREVANDLRATHGPAYIIEMLYERALKRDEHVLVESIRAIGEAEFLKSKDVSILAVDADRKLRYERIIARGASTDHVDFDTWVMQEERELASTVPWDMNIIGVMRVADARIENDGTLEELHAKVNEALSHIS